jgi:O-methyltransferase involved in polyketide biosynthesis
MTSGSEAVSPTAHYTGYVWARNGLSHPEFETLEGLIMFESLRPMMAVSGLLGRGTLESYLLARHRAIDALLEQAIEQRGVRQVIEVAAGLSPRGWRFARRYGERLTYIEADLPGMADRKRHALARIGSDPHRHMVRELDVLSEDGLAAVAGELEPSHGLAILTEGLLGYLPSDDVRAVWHRFAATLAGFAAGVYISDVHIGSDQDAAVLAFRVLLSLFVRRPVHPHFHSPEEVVAALKAAGFAAAEVRSAVDVTSQRGGRRGAPAPGGRDGPPAPGDRDGAPAPGGRDGARAPGDRAARLAHILEASSR